ncbi:MAG: hypothetical protein Q9160_006076 [Pyrenula sp. 1 TL-2023]
MATDLTDEIELIRKEIRAITRRRQKLTSSLLSSTRIQKRLNKHRRNDSTSRLKDKSHIPASTETAETALTNLYRLTSTATTFPFADPSPSQSPLKLPGVRIDICDPLSGQYAAPSPYYLLFRRNRHDHLSIYRHTIPAFVDLRELEDAFLGRPASEGQDENESDESEVREGEHKQDLHGLVRQVRKSLVAWTLRKSSIKKVQDELGLSAEEDVRGSRESTVDDLTQSMATKQIRHEHGITSVAPTAFDCRYVGIHWDDGRVARIKVADSGEIEVCVMQGNEGRLRAAERVLMAEGGRLEDLGGKLSDLIRENGGKRTEV